MSVFNIPYPHGKAWHKLVKSENLPIPEYNGTICSRVTLPVRWILLPSGYRNNYLIYDENDTKRAMVYMTDKVGFTVFF